MDATSTGRHAHRVGGCWPGAPAARPAGSEPAAWRDAPRQGRNTSGSKARRQPLPFEPPPLSLPTVSPLLPLPGAPPGRSLPLPPVVPARPLPWSSPAAGVGAGVALAECSPPGVGLARPWLSAWGVVVASPWPAALGVGVGFHEGPDVSGVAGRSVSRPGPADNCGDTGRSGCGRLSRTGCSLARSTLVSVNQPGASAANSPLAAALRPTTVTTASALPTTCQ